MPNNSEVNADVENPSISPLTDRDKSVQFSFWPDLDPAFPVTCISMFCNFALSNMFLYGVTGNARLAYLASTITIPVSLIVSVIDAKNDFENWTRTRRLREKGLAEKFMPYKVKYDWTQYEKHMAPRFHVSESANPVKPT